jgi:predicted secreted Zn-dependent protease
LGHAREDPRADGERSLKRLAVVALLAGSSSAFAAGEALTIDYFTIQGSTARELRSELNRLGPIGETGLRGDAYTRWRIAWKFDFAPRGPTCVADNIRVTLEVHMILPRWEPPPGVSASLLELWDRYLTALRFHEDGHYRIAISAADEVRRTLARHRRGGDCPALEKLLHSKANDILNRTRREQADFDRETDFGRNQGTSIL